MTLLKTFSLAPDARDWLANTHHARILHVFDHACNLVNERREILSVVTAQIGNGPFNLVIEDNVLFSNYLSLESTISIFPTHLQLGDLTLNTTDAELWSPRPDWKRLYAGRENILNVLTASPIPKYQPLLPYSLISNLSSALVNADISASLSITSKLNGLGIGLTPAGDDFILGAVLAVWIIHPPEIAETLAKTITETAAPLTTSLSAAWLRSAGRGEAGILWHQFFEAMLPEDTLQIEGAIAKILSMGETSGADALAGFIGTFRSWAVAVSSKNV